MLIYVSVTCNFQQRICYTSCLTFSTNHHWFQGVDWSHLEPPRRHRFPPFTPFQPSLKVQRKQLPSCCRVSWCAFGLSLPKHREIFRQPIFSHTQNHPMIRAPVSHFQLRKDISLDCFLLWKPPPCATLPQPTLQVTLSNCTRAILKHVTPHCGNVL